MTPDIKAIKTRAESIKHLSMMVMNKHEVSAMCDEIERLREQIGAYQLHEKQLLAAKMGLECKVDRLRADAAAYHALNAELDKQMGVSDD